MQNRSSKVAEQLHISCNTAASHLPRTIYDDVEIGFNAGNDGKPMGGAPTGAGGHDPPLLEATGTGDIILG